MKKSLLCKLGFHDWEIPDFSNMSYNGEYVDKVCLKCGEIDLQYTQWKREMEQRKKKARQIYNKYHKC